MKLEAWRALKRLCFAWLHIFFYMYICRWLYRTGMLKCGMLPCAVPGPHQPVVASPAVKCNACSFWYVSFLQCAQPFATGHRPKALHNYHLVQPLGSVVQLPSSLCMKVMMMRQWIATKFHPKFPWLCIPCIHHWNNMYMFDYNYACFFNQLARISSRCQSKTLQCWNRPLHGGLASPLLGPKPRWWPACASCEGKATVLFQKCWSSCDLLFAQACWEPSLAQ